MFEEEQEESEIALTTFTAQAAGISTGSATQARLLVVSCCADAATLLAKAALAAEHSEIKAALFATGSKTERNSWASSLGSGAGGVLVELEPRVLTIDLANIELGVDYLDLVDRLFAHVLPDAVVLLDRKFASHSEDLPALLTSSVAAKSPALAKFPAFLPPNILTGWSAAILTRAEAKSIPCYCFVAQDSNLNTFADSKVLDLFSVPTSSVSTKLTGLKVASDSSAGKPELVQNALFL
ncbi:UNVERIFIED_CONTAM: hypothetical protein HDU68_004085 [Siphonaria sp. JEL0065]|nr:hypothetical protein HDU68_004085 [Siphonaria sp. JEL0065]